MDLTFFRRRQATQEELSKGLEEMKKEQERLAREEVEERMLGRGEGAEGQGSMERPSTMTPPPTVFIGAPSQESQPGHAIPGETRMEKRPEKIGDQPPPVEVVQENQSGEVGGSFIPLFTEEQTRGLEELQRAAPLLLARQPDLERPAWLNEEERRRKEAQMEKEWHKEQQRMYHRLNEPEKAEMLEKIRTLEEGVQFLKKDCDQMRRDNDGLKGKNEELRIVNQKLAEEMAKMRIEEKKARGGRRIPRPKKSFLRIGRRKRPKARTKR